MPAPASAVYGCEDDEYDEDVEDSLVGWKVSDLPPMPPPKRLDMCIQFGGGCSYVLSQIALFVGGTHGIALTWLPKLLGPVLSDSVRATLIVLIYTETSVALICLAGLFFADPGVIQRSPETCFPLPRHIEELLRQGDSLEGVANHEENGRTFCTRCLVWRPEPRPSPFLKLIPRRLFFLFKDCKPSESHHCRTCGRCVAFFDHHCGVFGRCIAGTCCSGNMPYFVVIILMSICGFATCAASLALSLYQERDLTKLVRLVLTY